MVALFILLSTVFGVSGQLSMKYGMSRIGANGHKPLLRQMATSPWVLGGLTGYGAGVIFWLMALSRLAVSYLYPFASLSYVGIIIGSYFIFRERVTPLRLVGVVLIIIGVIITGLNF